MNNPPDILSSTAEERKEYVKKRFPCLSDCDMCGLCKVFHGKDPEMAFDEYIKGNRSFTECSDEYKK